MKEFFRATVLVLSIATVGPAAAAPTEGLPSADYPLTSKTVGQWIVMMTGFQELTRSDPALVERTRQEKYTLGSRDEASGARTQGRDLEKIARDEPKVRALLGKAGIKSSEANRISTACIAAAMTLTLRQRGVPANVGLQVPQANLDAVKPRHAEIMRLMGPPPGAPRDKRAQEPPAE